MTDMKVSCNDAESVVISGISARLPNSRNLDHFADQLLNGVDLVSNEGRCKLDIYELSKRGGILEDLSSFDAIFFGINSKQADAMDPQMRIMLELTHEAIVDAGLNPTNLRGSRTSVIISVPCSETGDYNDRDLDNISMYSLTGGQISMFANRISYTFDFKGPSYNVDAACCSSMCSFIHAYNSIKQGLCDKAIVAGCSLCLSLKWFLLCGRMNVLSSKGRCASFDSEGDGYVRSEAVVVLLLQKRRDARRVYATVRGVGMNVDGFKPRGITCPSRGMQRRLMEEIYADIGLRPQDVVYVEAHGTGTQVGDSEEVNAIADFYCKDTRKPLLLGSVKSNMGHSEAASGLSSIAKIVVAMERGIIPGNLHYKSPHPDIPALRDGRIQVVVRNTKWDGGIVGVNSFGFGGANTHVVLQSEGGMRSAAANYATMPRLLLASGRTDSAVRAMLSHGAQHAADAELHALIDAVHANAINGHPQRGYCILTEPPVSEVLYYDGVIRPIWFVFSGMGTQWNGMGRALMRIPVFATSVKHMATVLAPFGIDLLSIITTENIEDNIIYSFISITVIQVALVDVLHTVGIFPDGIVGHSIGEIGCAYADGVLTAEQSILIAYWRGRSIMDSKVVVGAMAVVGLSWEECSRRCPPDVYPSCDNAPDLVSVSGPVKSIDNFIAQLSSEKVFVRRINSSSVAFHCKYIKPAGILMREKIRKVIPNPKLRSKRWISSSLLQDQIDGIQADLCDHDYFVNNLLRPVQFARALREVPAHSMLIEVGPHRIFQSVLRGMFPDASTIALMDRDCPDQLNHLLISLGKMYCGGAQPQLGRLYPPVQWPVSRGTPGLASHVQWDHTIKWKVPDCSQPVQFGEHIVEYDLTSCNDMYLSGCVIDNVLTFPTAGYLVMIWRTMAKMKNVKLNECAITLENIQISQLKTISDAGFLRFLIHVSRSTGQFDISEGGNIIVTGHVRSTETSTIEHTTLHKCSSAEIELKDLPLSSEDMYKELRLRGYFYSGVFCGIRETDAYISSGSLTWNNNWVSFIETMLQLNIIGTDTRDLHVPKQLQRVIINPTAQPSIGVVPVHVNRDINVTVAGGVELWGVETIPIIRRNNLEPQLKLEKNIFIPYNNIFQGDNSTLPSKYTALLVSLQIVLENISCTRLRTCEVTQRPMESLLTPLMLSILDNEPQVQVDPYFEAGNETEINVNALNDLNIKVTHDLNGNYDVVLACNVISLNDNVMLVKLANALTHKGMLLIEEPHGTLDTLDLKRLLRQSGLDLISRQMTASCEFVLLKLCVNLPLKEKSIVVEVTEDESYNWVTKIQAALARAESEEMRVYIVGRGSSSGVIGLAKCLRAEPGGNALRIYYLPNERSFFSIDENKYAAQVRMDLAFNILNAGVWGSYRHLPLGEVKETFVKHAKIDMLTPGDLSSLCWIESPLRHVIEKPLPLGTELCYVNYISLNADDLMQANSMQPLTQSNKKNNLPNSNLGMEYSGRMCTGKRVMGIVGSGGLATTVLTDKRFLWEVPESWSLKEAATVPTAYVTAYYALIVRGRMRPGESILVHEGWSNLGQAAISIALNTGCVVFTTVNSPEKLRFLQQRFCKLLATNIFSLHDTSFEQMTSQLVRDYRVDLFLSSQTETLQASLLCLAPGGRLLVVGNQNCSNSCNLVMPVFLKNITCHSIQFKELLDMTAVSEDVQMAVECLRRGIANGTVKPLPYTVFLTAQLEPAFLFLATGEYIGKVLVCVDEVTEARGNDERRIFATLPRTYMHPTKSYILVGGLGGFGLELARWLVMRGCTKFVLVSRNGIRTGYQAWCIRRWRAMGITVQIWTGDTTTEAGARALLETATTLGPVGGVFNLAVELRDAFMDKQSPETFRTVAKPKVDVTKSLDLATRELAPELEHFVLFSSVSCGRGNAGQSNYGFANSVMERIAEQRRADSLPALAIQWGPIGDVGLLTRIVKNNAILGKFLLNGTCQQSVGSCLASLDRLMCQSYPVVGSLALADKKPPRSILRNNFVDQVADIIGISKLNRTSESASLVELGMDSLMGAQIQQMLEQGYNVVLSASEIRNITMERLRALSKT